jgi:hypothetical protein
MFILQKQVFVECLVEALRGEADKAKQSTGISQPVSGNQEAVERKLSWPSNRTWPLLSRIAFTLANLTTSNEENRVVIGTSVYKIIALLQVGLKGLLAVNRLIYSPDQLCVCSLVVELFPMCLRLY